MILAGLQKEPLDEAGKECLERISDLMLVGEFKEALAVANTFMQYPG
jgi:hypothetical protein